jgi:hypothetical protein
VSAAAAARFAENRKEACRGENAGENGAELDFLRLGAEAGALRLSASYVAANPAQSFRKLHTPSSKPLSRRDKLRNTPAVTAGGCAMMKWYLIAAMAAGLAACSSPPHPIPAGTETVRYGRLVSGGKFGVEVGRPAADAPQALWDAGYGYQGEVACTGATQALFACRDGDTFMRFQPVALDRKGAVYLKLEKGRVSEIGWDLKNVPAQEG